MLNNIFLVIPIVIVLMALDYFLTIIGVKLYNKTYAKFIQHESYELNPTFKESVRKHKYSLRHLFSIILVVILMSLAYYLSEYFPEFFSKDLFYFMQGAIYSQMICLISNHIRNILIFRAINRNPKMLSGRVKQSARFSLIATMANYSSIFVIFLFLLIIIPNSFMLGFAAGPLYLLLKAYKWIRKAKRAN